MPKQATAAQPQTATGDALVSVLLREKGEPYTYGGANPKQGFDCSGLVYWAMNKRLNIKWPYRVAAAQSAHCSAVPVDQALQIRGALLFIGAPGLSHHVAVAMGDGRQIIDANHTGGHVGVRPAAGYGFNAAGLVPELVYGGQGIGLSTFVGVGADAAGLGGGAFGAAGQLVSWGATGAGDVIGSELGAVGSQVAQGMVGALKWLFQELLPLLKIALGVVLIIFALIVLVLARPSTGALAGDIAEGGLGFALGRATKKKAPKAARVARGVQRRRVEKRTPPQPKERSLPRGGQRASRANRSAIERTNPGAIIEPSD